MLNQTFNIIPEKRQGVNVTNEREPKIYRFLEPCKLERLQKKSADKNDLLPDKGRKNKLAITYFQFLKLK